MKFPKYLLPVLCLALIGCATSRSSLNIQVPMAVQPSQEDSIGQIYIRSVVDQREFQDRPSSPDVPSLRGKKASKASAELKSQAIGRKRNSMGQALGDFVLEGSTVKELIYHLTRNALSSLNYEVTNDKEAAKPDAIILDVKINKLWSWFVPGFSWIHIRSNILTTNEFTWPDKMAKTLMVEASVEESYQIATNSNWRRTLVSSTEYFERRAKIKFKELKPE